MRPFLSFSSEIKTYHIDQRIFFYHNNNIGRKDRRRTKSMLKMCKHISEFLTNILSSFLIGALYDIMINVLVDILDAWHMHKPPLPNASLEPLNLKLLFGRCLLPYEFPATEKLPGKCRVACLSARLKNETIKTETADTVSKGYHGSATVCLPLWLNPICRQETHKFQFGIV